MRWNTSISVALLAVVALSGPAFGGITVGYQNDVTVSGEGLYQLGGLTYQGGALYAGDTYIGSSTADPNHLLVHAINPPDGAILQKWNVGSTNGPILDPVGMGSKATANYLTAVTGQATGNLQLFNGTLTGTLPLAGPVEQSLRAKGLAYDGKYLWQAHYSPTAGHLYAIDPADNSIVNDLAVDPYPYGLAYDGRYLWVMHQNPDAGAHSLAKYDRAGNVISRWAIDAALDGVALGDIALNSGSLWAVRQGENTLALFSVTGAEAAAALPSMVTAMQVTADASITFGGTEYTDTQAGAVGLRLPSTASLHHVSAGLDLEVVATARGYYDGTDYHNTAQAQAYGDDNSGALQSVAGLTVAKTILIPSSSVLPAGTRITATGRLTVHGTLLLSRDEVEDDATGASGTLTIGMTKNDSTTLFNGQVGILGVTDEGDGTWAGVTFGGSLDVPVFTVPATAGVTIADGLVTMDLDHIVVPFAVPAVVGVSFTLDTIFEAQASLGASAEGIGVEATFGESTILIDSYAPATPPGSYADGYTGDSVEGESLPIPEPAVTLLLLIGAGLARRRRRC